MVKSPAPRRERPCDRGYRAIRSALKARVYAMCDRVGIRTQDLLLRRQLLYPAELLDLYYMLSQRDLTSVVSRGS